jgi:hypothetical protein
MVDDLVPDCLGPIVGWRSWFVVRADGVPRLCSTCYGVPVELVACDSLPGLADVLDSGVRTAGARPSSAQALSTPTLR